jgi:hypothetical protein
MFSSIRDMEYLYLPESDLPGISISEIVVEVGFDIPHPSY